MNLQILQQDDQNKTEYGEGNENDSSIKFETNIIKLFLCDYSDACILITGDIKAPGWNEILMLHLKIVLHLQDDINDEHIILLNILIL